MNQTTAITALGRPGPASAPSFAQQAKSAENDPKSAAALREAYTQFVGETLFGSMLKAARKTVGEPAYFHGGMAEEQFQAQLDQQWAADLASSGSSFTERLFRTEFPAEAKVLDDAKSAANERLAELESLHRR